MMMLHVALLGAALATRVTENEKTAMAFIGNLEQNAFDMNFTALYERNLPLIDEDVFTGSLLPGSLGVPSRKWSDYASNQTALMEKVGGFSEFVVTYSRTLKAGRRTRRGPQFIVMYATSQGVTNLTGDYRAQYVLTLEFNRRGKLVRYEEFLDSLLSACSFGILPPAVCAAIV